MKRNIAMYALVAALIAGAYWAGMMRERHLHQVSEHSFPEDGLVVVGNGGIRITSLAGDDYCLPLQPTDKPQVFRLVYMQAP